KHGLKGAGGLKQALLEIADRVARSGRDGGTATSQPIVLAVDSSSSKTVRSDFARDLARLRTGRTDPLADITRDVMASLGANVSNKLLPRLHVVTISLDSDEQPDLKFVRHLVRQ